MYMQMYDLQMFPTVVTQAIEIQKYQQTGLAAAKQKQHRQR